MEQSQSRGEANIPGRDERTGNYHFIRKDGAPWHRGAAGRFFTLNLDGRPATPNLSPRQHPEHHRQDKADTQEYLETVAKRMTNDQIGEAKWMVREWMAKHQR